MSESMNLQLAEIPNTSKTGLLQFSKISINEDYRKKWNIHETDFVCLTKNGELVRDTLYRIGGLGTPKLNVDEYFMIIKHVEAFYSHKIMKMSKSKDNRHLEGRWCILDKKGNEKVEFKQFSSVYLVENSQIYSINNDYYNVETGYFYCRSYHSFSSNNFLFLDNRFDDDKSKLGVIKIDKKTGEFELFQ